MDAVLEENKEIVRRFVEELLNRGNLAAAEELVASDFVLHLPGHPPIQGREAFKEGLQHWRSAFPDWHITIEELIAEGDKVAGRWTVRGTHRGPLMGIPPTGKQVSWTANDIFRIANGKIAENTAEEDMLTLMRQLGALSEMVKS